MQIDRLQKITCMQVCYVSILATEVRYKDALEDRNKSNGKFLTSVSCAHLRATDGVQRAVHGARHNGLDTFMHERVRRVHEERDVALG